MLIASTLARPGGTLEVLYTEYSQTKGQPLLNWCQHHFATDSFGKDAALNWNSGCSDHLDHALLVYTCCGLRRNARPAAWVKVATGGRDRRCVRRAAAQLHHSGGGTGSGWTAAPT